MTRIALALLLFAAVLLALAQIVLPRIAAGQISSRVGRYGTVESVKVSAWPAIELLWGRADSVSLTARNLTLTPAQSVDLLAQARDTARLDFTATDVREGPLRLSEAHLRKRGAELTGEGLITAADVTAALPPGVRVELLGSREGRVEVRVGGGLFGLGASVTAVAGAGAGQLVVRPLIRPLQGLSLTLFSDPRVQVDGVSAVVASRTPTSYRLGMSATLR
jgi:hypothetical protein